MLTVLITSFNYWNEIKKPNWFAASVLFIALISSVALAWATYKFLAGKYQYTSKELDPVVNDFSRNADKDNIKFLAGNLDFFGKSGQQIEQHPQYLCLRQESFRLIQILFTPPISNEDKWRYGKLITDLPTIQLRFYSPLNADLKVRGRIKTLNNVTRLLIYSKISLGKYEALELNTSDTDGALYSHLWDLIWGLAESPTQADLNGYINLYRS